MGREFQFCKRKRFLEINGIAGCTTLSVYLIPPNCVLKNSSNGTFYVMCTLPQFMYTYMYMYMYMYMYRDRQSS